MHNIALFIAYNVFYLAVLIVACELDCPPCLLMAEEGLQGELAISKLLCAAMR